MNDFCPQRLRVLDLGCGSGAVVLALAQFFGSLLQAGQVEALEQVEFWAVDVSKRRWQWRRNAQALRVPVRFCQGSWWEALSEPAATAEQRSLRFDVVVVNRLHRRR